LKKEDDTEANESQQNINKQKETNLQSFEKEDDTEANESQQNIVTNVISDSTRLEKNLSKKISSNEKRLESLKKREEERKKIKKSNNDDNNKPITGIIFSISSEEESNENLDKVKEKDTKKLFETDTEEKN